MNVIAVIGASGYVGRHLLAKLAQTEGVRVKVLSRLEPEKFGRIKWPANVEVVKGDLQYPQSLNNFFEAGCTVINLAYLWTAGEAGNLAAIRNLIDACKKAQVLRLIHCSTAIVVGCVAENLITEKTLCNPTSSYERTKLQIEYEVINGTQGYFDTVVLRPTSVFGPEALPLKKLTSDLVSGSRFMNYVKACFLGRRRMNLVCVANLIAAILFMVRYERNLKGEIFIVSDDAAPANNYADIERTLVRLLNGKEHIFPPIPLPYFLLRATLQLLGKENIKPNCSFAQDKLQDIGFKGQVNFEDGLLEYADWYRAEYLAGIPQRPL